MVRLGVALGSMFFNFLAQLTGTIVGGALAFAGTWYGSRHAAQQARRERERAACQAILRLLAQIQEALYDELKIRQLKAGEEDPYTPATDRLVDELAVLITDVTGTQKEVERLNLCVETLVHRHRNWSIGSSAVSTMKEIVTARLRQQKDVAAWVDSTSERLHNYLAEIHEEYKENRRSQQQWEQEERERRQRGDAPEVT